MIYEGEMHMTVATFITLLTLFSAVTGLIVEAVKKILDEKKKNYSSNILACIVACVVGIGGTCVYYVFMNIPFTAINIICMVIMGVASAVGAMVGYDKVIQTIGQFKNR